MQPVIITKSAFETLQAIAQFIAANQFSPTIRELMGIHKLASPSPVQARLNQLIEAQAISIVANKARTLQVLISSDRFAAIDRKYGYAGGRMRIWHYGHFTVSDPETGNDLIFHRFELFGLIWLMRITTTYEL
jgi:SOS-response transcriptional repressor LexA